MRYGKVVPTMMLHCLRSKRLLSSVCFGVIVILLFAGCTHTAQTQYIITFVNLNKNLVFIVDEFKKNMKDLGYVEGENIRYIENDLTLRIKGIQPVVQIGLKEGTHLFFTLTTPATKRVKDLVGNSGPPIFFTPVFSPIRSKLVGSFDHPAENITGITVSGGVEKALELFLKAVPTVRTLFVPLHQGNLAAQQSFEDLQRAAVQHNISLVTERVQSSEDLAAAMVKISSGIDAVWVSHSHLIINNIATIIEWADKYNLPVGTSTDQIKEGALLAFSAHSESIGYQASRMVDKILLNKSAEHIPVERSEFFLSVNLKKARQLNLTINNDLLNQADFILR